MGECTLSVRVMTFALRLLANSNAFNVRIEYRGKLIPMIRTLISIPAGVSKMNLVRYTVSSTLGILIWNLFFVGAGYFLGDTLLQYLN